MGIGFGAPCYVPKNGALPHADALEVSFEPAAGSTEAIVGRRLGSADDAGDTDFWVEVTSFTENGLEFKMNFSNPSAVSKSNKNKDKMKITLRKNTFFARDPPHVALSGVLNMDLAVPKQFPSKDDAIMADKIADSVTKLLVLILGLAFILQLFFR